MGVDKVSRSRSRTAYVGTVVGITLVLFMLGILGAAMLNANQLSNYLKENIRVQMFLKHDQSEAEVMQFRKELDTEPFARETRYVTANDAAEQLKEDLGEEFEIATIGPAGENGILFSCITHDFGRQARHKEGKSSK